jgi:hypothetical protein
MLEKSFGLFYYLKHVKNSGAMLYSYKLLPVSKV